MPQNDIARQLAQLLNDLKAVNAGLVRVNEGWADPPEPDKPAIRTSLNEMKNEAALTTRYANGLLGRLG